MKKIVAPLIMAFMTKAAFADRNQFLSMYYDCLSSTNFLSNNIPVFTKVDGKRIKNNYSAGAYTRGIEFSMTTDSDDNIVSFKLGKSIEVSLPQIENGLEFGVVKITSHTIQLLDFDPATGGTFEFGYLKNVTSHKSEIKLAKIGRLSDYYLALYGDHWGTFQVQLLKNETTGQWELINHHSEQIKAIFGVMKMKNKIMVHGITEMLSATQEQDLRTSGSVITLMHDGRQYKCEI